MAATTSNRRQYASVIETTLGVTPASPRMRLRPATQDTLSYAPAFTNSNELRSDRMTSDPVIVGLDSGGAISWELHYIVPDSPADVEVRSAMNNNFVNTPVRDNDGTADSVITDIGTVANTVTVIAPTGAGNNSGTFAVGHLVRTTGFALAGNNKVAVVTTGGSTSFVATGAAYSAEAVPPATARAKVVGFAGGANDLATTVTGMTSTTLDFTTLGLAVGQWIKIGATATANRFATAAVNKAVRVTAIAAHTLSLDNLPTGWVADAGTGKSIYVWFGDGIVNGTTQISQTFERGDLGMAAPAYIAQPGMVVQQFAMTLRPKQIITGQTVFMGMGGGTISTTPLDAVPDPIPSQAIYPQFAGSAHVGRVAEFGVQLSTPNWCTGIDLTIANNLQAVETLDAVGPQDLPAGQSAITGTLMTLFGDLTIASRFQNGTVTSLNFAVQRGVQMMILTLPRVVLNGGGNPNAGGLNQLMPVNFNFTATKDEALTGVEIRWDRLEYFEA
jgi:hypothetical protein